MKEYKDKIVNDHNYHKYIHYLETNLIGLSILKIFKYRILSSLKNLLYIDKKGNLSIVEDGVVYVKRRNNNQRYLLTKFENYENYSLFIKNTEDNVKLNLNNWCLIKHKIFKNFYLIYPYNENDDKTLKFIAKEGKINLIVLLFAIVFFIIGFLSVFGII